MTLLVQHIGPALYFADLPLDAIVAWVAVVLLSPILGVAQCETGLPAAPAGATLADKAGRLADRICNSPRLVPADAFLRDINSLHATVQAAATALALAIGGLVCYTP